MFAPDSVTNTIESFNEQATEERLRYKSIYIDVEDYISKFTELIEKKIKTPDEESKDGGKDRPGFSRVQPSNHVILGGSMSIALLLGKSLSRDDFMYCLFSENAFKHANDLTNKLAADITTSTNDKNKPFWVISLKTIVPFKKFDISINQRTLISFTTLNRMSDTVTVNDMIQPLTVKSYFEKKTILIMPPKFHLIDTYEMLYSPANTDDWSNQLHEEQRLFGYMQKIMNLQRQGKTARVGGEDIKINQPLRNKVALKLLQELFVNNPKIMLLGEHAINMLTGSSIDTPIIHCMIDPSIAIDDLIKQIQPIVDDALGKHINIFSATRNVQILGDFRLRRTSIKLGNSIDSKEIIYCYNSTEYDLIPTNRLLEKNDPSKIILIGNPFVLIRFMLIELWILVWISSMGKIDKSFALARSNSLISKVLGLRSKISAKNKSSIDPEYLEMGPLQIFQTDPSQYIGIYESESTAQKTKAQTAQRFSEYYPQEWFNKNDSYRNQI